MLAVSMRPHLRVHVTRKLEPQSSHGENTTVKACDKNQRQYKSHCQMHPHHRNTSGNKIAPVRSLQCTLACELFGIRLNFFMANPFIGSFIPCT